MSTATAELPVKGGAKSKSAAPHQVRRFELLIGSHVQLLPEFEDMPLDQLKELAAGRGIEVDSLWSKATARSELLRRLGAERVYDAGEVVEQAVTHNWCPACRSQYPLGVNGCTRCRVGEGESSKPYPLGPATLEAMFGRDKFRAVDEQPVREVVREVVKDRPVVLDAMNLQELREYAEAQEVELPAEADTKAKVAQAIAAALKR